MRQPLASDGNHLVRILESGRLPHPHSVYSLYCARSGQRSPEELEWLDSYQAATALEATHREKTDFLSALDRRRVTHTATTVGLPRWARGAPPSTTLSQFRALLAQGKLPHDADYRLAHWLFMVEDLTPIEVDRLRQFITSTALGVSDARIMAGAEQLAHKRGESAVPVPVAVDWRQDVVLASGLVNTLLAGHLPATVPDKVIRAADHLALDDTARDLLRSYSTALSSLAPQNEVDRFRDLLSLQGDAVRGLTASQAGATRPQPQEIARAVAAFKTMVSITPVAASGANAGPRFSLPLIDSSVAARLLFRAVATAAAAAGSDLQRKDLARLHPHARLVDAYVDAIADATRLDPASLALLRSAAPRVGRVIELLVKNTGNRYTPRNASFLIGTLDLRSESLADGAPPNREALQRLANRLTVAYHHESLNNFVAGGPFERHLDLVRAAHDHGLLSTSQSEVLAQQLRDRRAEFCSDTPAAASEPKAMSQSEERV